MIYNTRSKSESGGNGPARNIQYYVPKEATKLQMDPIDIAGEYSNNVPYAKTENRAPEFKSRNLDSLRANQGDKLDPSSYKMDLDQFDVAGELPPQPTAANLYTNNSLKEGNDIPLQGSRTPSSYGQEDIDAMARFVSGASPTLLNFLMGGSAASTYSNDKEAQNYYKAGTPQKLDLIKGPEGQPIYENVGNSVGKEAFQKPVKLGNPAAGTSSVDMINRTTGQSTKAIANRGTGQIIEFGSGKILSPEEWMPTVPTLDLQKSTQLSGADTLIPVNKFVPNAPAPKAIGLNEGLGTRYNLPEKEVLEGNKWAVKTAGEVRPYLEGRANIKGAMDLLQKSPDRDNAIIQAAGIFRTAKMVVNERISEQERAFVTAAPDYLTNLANKVASGITGAQRENVITQMKQILTHLDEVQKKSIQMIQDTNVMGYSGGEKNKAKYLSDRIVNSVGTSGNTPPDNTKINYDPSTLKQVTPDFLNEQSVNKKITENQLKSLTPQQVNKLHDEIYSKLSPEQKKKYDNMMKGGR